MNPIILFFALIIGVTFGVGAAFRISAHNLDKSNNYGDERAKLKDFSFDGMVYLKEEDKVNSTIVPQPLPQDSAVRYKAAKAGKLLTDPLKVPQVFAVPFNISKNTNHTQVQQPQVQPQYAQPQVQQPYGQQYAPMAQPQVQPQYAQPQVQYAPPAQPQVQPQYAQPPVQPQYYQNNPNGQ